MDTVTEIFETYLAELVGHNQSPSTIRKARWSAGKFAAWVDKQRIPPSLVDRAIVKLYLYGDRHVIGLSKSKIKNGDTINPTTFNQAQGGIGQFLQWAASEEHLRDGLRLACKPLRGTPEKRQPRVRVDQLLEAFEECTDPRDRIFLSTAMHTLGRASEMRLVQLKHIDWVAQEILWYSEKKDRWDVKAMDKRFMEHIREWIVEYETAVGRPHEGSWFLIPTRFTHPRTRRVYYNPKASLWTMGQVTHKHFDRYFAPDERAGIGAHLIRRSAARALFDHLCQYGYDSALAEVAGQLDHYSRATTEVYLGLQQDKERLRARIKGGSIDFLGFDTGRVVPLRKAN